jgi:hypothetical protein
VERAIESSKETRRRMPQDVREALVTAGLLDAYKARPAYRATTTSRGSVRQFARRHATGDFGRC